MKSNYRSLPVRVRSEVIARSITWLIGLVVTVSIMLNIARSGQAAYGVLVALVPMACIGMLSLLWVFKPLDDELSRTKRPETHPEQNNI